MIRLIAVASVVALSAGAARAEPAMPKFNYPTTARADYVIGCLAGSGFKRELLDRCSCAIDTIANLMPYDDYDQAATILSMQQGGLGARTSMFRDTPIAKQRTEELRRAQAEASLRCL
jgi:hypothetical protein